MKNNYFILFLLLFFLKISTGNCTKYTITTNPNLTFAPPVVNASVGDTIIFALGGTIHSAVQVSKATWSTNPPGNTSNGGFQYPVGVTDTLVLTQGSDTLYYVCGVHYSLGMKGEIIVSNPTGVNNLVNTPFQLGVFPNPASRILTVQTNIFAGKENEISIFDVTGKVLYKENNPSSLQYIDVSGFLSGIYILSIKSDSQFIERKLVVSK